MSDRSRPPVQVRHTLLWTLVACCAALALASGASAATAPPDLGGEWLYAWQNYLPGSIYPPAGPDDVVTTVSRSCDPNGDATLKMTATGTAQGPYPGSFREDIDVTMGPVLHENYDNREVRSMTGSFTVDSAVGHVEGTHYFDRALTPSTTNPDQAAATGWCENEAPSPDLSGPEMTMGGAFTGYKATITTPDGCTYLDDGGDAVPADSSIFAGGFRLIDASFPLGRNVNVGFQSDGQPLARSGDCGAPPEEPFAGYFPPVDNPPVLNEVNAGRTIPMKFSLHGDRGMDLFADGYPRSEQVDCSVLPTIAVDGLEATDAAGASDLSYDGASDRYTYAWKTSSTWAGTCRQFVMKLRDGSVHRANFRFP